MIQVVVAIRDRALDAFMQPYFVSALGLATRVFSDEVNNPESPMSKHPEDYDLYQLGEFDAQSGSFSGGPPRQVAIGKDQVKGVSGS